LLSFTDFAMSRKRKYGSCADEKDSVIFFKGLASRLTIARSERELKHCFHIVSRWKAVFNETAVEFVPGEKKTKRAIPVKRNNMFSVLPGGVRTTVRSIREPGKEYYFKCALSTSDFVFLRKMSFQFATEFTRNDLCLWFMKFENEELNRVSSDESPSQSEKPVCDVCKLATRKEMNEIVVCNSCEKAVHQACYGIANIPEEKWICNRCIYIEKTGVMPTCILCPNETGLMKSDASGTTWLHMSCAIWIPGISFGNSETLEPITGVEKALKKMSSLAKKNKKQMCCSICNSSFGAFIKCQNKRCSARFHVTCASNGNAYMNLSLNSENSGQVFFEIYCNAHSPGEHEDSTDTVDNIGKSSESSEIFQFDLPSAEDSPALKNKTKAEISVIKEQFRLYWLAKRKMMNTTEPFVQVMRAAQLNNNDFDRTLKLSNRKKFLAEAGKKDKAKRVQIWSDDENCDKKDEEEMVHKGMRLRSSRRSKSLGPSFFYKRDKQL
ncbi:Protein Jade-1, partial [Trichinella zimbabwensis]